jgi:hypothetical protein
MPRRLLLVHPSRLDGENRGIYEQHVVSMHVLLGGSPDWEVHALDVNHPSFPDAALAAELVVLHMLAAPEIEAVIHLRRARRLPTIFEISDNFLDVGGWLPARHALRNPLVRQRIAYHAALADAVQVYAPGLAALCRHLHDRVVQLDPYVPLEEHAVARGEGIVIGWGGSTSHEDDLTRVAPIIEALCRRRNDVVFAFMGNEAMGERLFGRMPVRQRRMRPFGDLASYLAFVRGWHIGLAPLRHSAFNACRTDTKIATYAACGVAPVAEASEAYGGHGDHALLYRGLDGLREALEWLCDDRSRIDALAGRARAWVTRERHPDRLRAQRVDAYEPFISRQTGEPLAMAADAPALTGDVDALRATVRAHPSYAQARLALADALRTHGDEHGALAVLDARPFPAVFASVAAERQHALARRIRPERAEAYAAQVESPVARLRLEHRGGERGAFLRSLLERQPFDYFALSTRLRELLAGDRDADELRDVCRRACLVAPELVPADLRPPSLTRFLPAAVVS